MILRYAAAEIWSEHYRIIVQIFIKYFSSTDTTHVWSSVVWMLPENSTLRADTDQPWLQAPAQNLPPLGSQQLSFPS